MCRPFGKSRGLICFKMALEDVEEMFWEGFIHLKFCVTFCKMQSDGGKYLMCEHPADVRSWVLNTIKEIMNLPGVMLVDFDVFHFNVTSKNSEGKAPVKKRTKAMINSF